MAKTLCYNMFIYFILFYPIVAAADKCGTSCRYGLLCGTIICKNATAIDVFDSLLHGKKTFFEILKHSCNFEGDDVLNH
jgi:hypothetical protein